MDSLSAILEWNMIRVIDEPDLRRDENGVIHNINQDDFRSYIQNRSIMLKEKQRIDKLEKDTEEIKQSLSVILQLLLKDK